MYIHFIYLFFLIHSQKLMISLSYWLHSLQTEFLKCPGIGLVLSPSLVSSDDAETKVQ